MIHGSFSFTETAVPFILPAVVGLFSLIAGIYCIMISIKQIRRQMKLFNSIALVRLRSAKFHYLVFIIIVALLTVFMAAQMSEPKLGDFAMFDEYFGMNYALSVLTYSFVFFLIACVEFLLIVILNSKSAVVDRGIYTTLTYLDWYNVHDYLIDEEKGIVVLTSARETFNTIQGTTPPLRVAKNDISKLKFILNKNKNKFSGFNKDTKSF